MTPIADQIDAALDRLAIEIDAFGERGARLLPLYRRLEKEAARLDADHGTMDNIRLRLTRSRDRTAARSA